MVELQVTCPKCSRLPGEHTPFEMGSCYGMDYLLRFIDNYDKRQEKSALKFYAILQEYGRQIKKFAKQDWKFFKEFKLK